MASTPETAPAPVAGETPSDPAVVAAETPTGIEESAGVAAEAPAPATIEPAPGPSKFRVYADGLGRVWSDTERLNLNAVLGLIEHIDEIAGEAELASPTHHIKDARVKLELAWHNILQHVVATSTTPQAPS